MDIKTKQYLTKLFDNDLVAIRKSKVTFTLNKPTKVRMCILDLSKVCTSYITITLKTNIVITQDCYSLTMVV